MLTASPYFWTTIFYDNNDDDDKNNGIDKINANYQEEEEEEEDRSNAISQTAFKAHVNFIINLSVYMSYRTKVI